MNTRCAMNFNKNHAVRVRQHRREPYGWSSRMSDGLETHVQTTV